jgi:outer membrane lipoprotein SlyB
MAIRSPDFSGLLQAFSQLQASEALKRQREEAAKNRASQRRATRLRTIGAVGGAIAGGFYGGPQGAAAGAAVGNTFGGIVAAERGDGDVSPQEVQVAGAQISQIKSREQQEREAQFAQEELQRRRTQEDVRLSILEAQNRRAEEAHEASLVGGPTEQRPLTENQLIQNQNQKTDVIENLRATSSVLDELSGTIQRDPAPQAPARTFDSAPSTTGIKAPTIGLTEDEIKKNDEKLQSFRKRNAELLQKFENTDPRNITDQQVVHTSNYTKNLSALQDFLRNESDPIIRNEMFQNVSDTQLAVTDNKIFRKSLELPNKENRIPKRSDFIEAQDEEGNVFWHNIVTGEASTLRPPKTVLTKGTPVDYQLTNGETAPLVLKASGVGFINAATGREVDPGTIRGRVRVGKRRTYNPDTGQFVEEDMLLDQEVGKRTKGDIEKNLVEGAESIIALKGMERRYDKKHLTYLGRLRAKFLQEKEKAGISLTGKEKRDLGDFVSFRTESLDFLNNYLKNMSGVAISEKEMARLQKTMPNPGDSPTTYINKLKTVRNKIEKKMILWAVLKQKGFEGANLVSKISNKSITRSREENQDVFNFIAKSRGLDPNSESGKKAIVQVMKDLRFI